MDKESEETKRNPLWNLIKEEWKNLGSRRKIFSFYVFLFFIAGIISLMSPLVIGHIFNLIQQSITSESELNKVIFMIFLLLILQVGF